MRSPTAAPAAAAQWRPEATRISGVATRISGVAWRGVARRRLVLGGGVGRQGEKDEVVAVVSALVAAGCRPEGRGGGGIREEGRAGRRGSHGSAGARERVERQGSVALGAYSTGRRDSSHVRAPLSRLTLPSLPCRLARSLLPPAAPSPPLFSHRLSLSLAPHRICIRDCARLRTCGTPPARVAPGEQCADLDS